MNEEFIPKQDVSTSLLHELYDWVEAGMMAVVAVVLLFTFVVRMAGVDGNSMNPTLEQNDRLFISRLNYTPQNGDIVVATKPNSRGEPLIKRVIAVGGQTVSIDFNLGIVYVDGQALDEPYVGTPTNVSYDTDFSQPVLVPYGHVFLMGDNRNYSWDSRASQVGMVDQRYILGKVVYRLLPYHNMGVPK